MKPLLALPPHIEPIIEPIDLELSDSLKSHLEFTRQAQELAVGFNSCIALAENGKLMRLGDMIEKGINLM